MNEQEWARYLHALQDPILKRPDLLNKAWEREAQRARYDGSKVPEKK